MADRTGIEWTDATWNPVTGCSEVSPGCDHCYARTFAERWRGIPGHHFERGFDVQLRPDTLTLPSRWRRPRRVFVNSMSDLFHDQVPDDYIACVFAVMAGTARHTYQVLTKRHGRMRAVLSSPGFRQQVLNYLEAWGDEEDTRFLDIADEVRTAAWPLPNVWLGVSVEDQKRADLRVPALLETPAAARFLSCEPLLGPVDLLQFHGIDWVIVGGESGPGARPMHPGWARLLRDQCTATGVPFFFKQWGAWRPAQVTNPPARPCRYTEDPAPMVRVGKTAAGRELDGRTWDEFPHTTTADGRRSA